MADDLETLGGEVIWAESTTGDEFQCVHVDFARQQQKLIWALEAEKRNLEGERDEYKRGMTSSNEALHRLVPIARRALDEMCRTSAPRNSFTDVVDQLDAELASY